MSGRAAAWSMGLLLGLLLGPGVPAAAEDQHQDQQDQQQEQQDRPAQPDDQEQRDRQASQSDNKQASSQQDWQDQRGLGATPESLEQRVSGVQPDRQESQQDKDQAQQGDDQAQRSRNQTARSDLAQRGDLGPESGQRGDREQRNDQAPHSDARGDQHAELTRVHAQPSAPSEQQELLDRPDHTDKLDKQYRMEHQAQHGPADGRCIAGDDSKDCAADSATERVATEERRLSTLLHGKPLTPDEDAKDLGFLYARSLSLSVDEDSNAASLNMRGRALRNRVIGQTWCSAVTCPVSAALTLANTTGRHSNRKIGQGEAVVACLDCSFSATSVSIVDGEAVCASASSSSVPRGVCVSLCQWEGLDCSCSAGCSSYEMGSDSVHSYSYQVTAATSVADQLGYLHRLLVRVHNTAEHLNIAAMLDVPGKTHQIRANIERRFGREKAKLVPVLLHGGGSGSLQ